MTRLTLRLSFREWSRLADIPNGLKHARAWIAITERIMNGPPIAAPTSDELLRDLALFGRSAALVTSEGVKRVDPWLAPAPAAVGGPVGGSMSADGFMPIRWLSRAEAESIWPRLD